MLYSSDFVFSGQHTRTVNRVRFHENDAHLLLSGSQDGSMHIFVSGSGRIFTLYMYYYWA